MFAEKKDKRRAERDSCDYSKYNAIRVSINTMKDKYKMRWKISIRCDESKYKCDESKRRGNPEEHIYDPGSFVVQDFHKWNLGRKRADPTF